MQSPEHIAKHDGKIIKIIIWLVPIDSVALLDVSKEDVHEDRYGLF